MHGILFFTLVGVTKTFIIIFFTGIIGWLMRYINEKTVEGSIFSSWCIHGVANTFSGLCSAFSIF